MDDPVCCFHSWAPLPLCPPDVTHVMNAPRPSLYFNGLLLPCISVNANESGCTGNEASILVHIHHRVKISSSFSYIIFRFFFFLQQPAHL